MIAIDIPNRGIQLQVAMLNWRRVVKRRKLVATKPDAEKP